MPEIDVPKRNKQVKNLLQITYPGIGVSVRAGHGTAYHWIEITFARRVGNPPGMIHNSVQSAIEDLIIGAGIHVSTYPSEYGGVDGRCITVTMPRERTAS